MVPTSQKSCSVCGQSFPLAEFTYGNRENRSYCLQCAKRVNRAYSSGGREAAHEFREAMRRTWKKKKKPKMN